jgi:hypothetical protein
MEFSSGLSSHGPIAAGGAADRDEGEGDFEMALSFACNLCANAAMLAFNEIAAVLAKGHALQRPHAQEL